MNNPKIVLAIMAFGLLCFMGTAAAIPHHDGHSSHGIGTVHHSSWWQPVTHHWYTPSYYYYNSFDPWWNANFYGPLRNIYYWYSWR
jgi:hypothetical protein